LKKSIRWGDRGEPEVVSYFLRGSGKQSGRRESSRYCAKPVFLKKSGEEKKGGRKNTSNTGMSAGGGGMNFEYNRGKDHQPRRSEKGRTEFVEGGGTHDPSQWEARLGVGFPGWGAQKVKEGEGPRCRSQGERVRFTTIGKVNSYLRGQVKTKKEILQGENRGAALFVKENRADNLRGKATAVSHEKGERSVLSSTWTKRR